MDIPQHDSDQALACPEPASHPSWHRHGPKPARPTRGQQQRNQELLLWGLRTDHTHHRRAEAI